MVAHAQGVFGRAGFPSHRSTNLRMATTPSFGSEKMMAPFL
jgi:hypothetical protein